ncbi:hypothetical protein CDAR_538961 [Caerostris darwini]|uniref:Uncharacterized protein n=1 Tax=Caerostris darwini TaxID=1538125 RepID=A0AAV4T1E5_9ARAC|nr:hypothetical protein CDAR_538961 [Caerostris darwini]
MYEHIWNVEGERRKLALRNSSAPHRHFVIVLTLQVRYSRSVRKSYPMGLPLQRKPRARLQNTDKTQL